MFIATEWYLWFDHSTFQTQPIKIYYYSKIEENLQGFGWFWA